MLLCPCLEMPSSPHIITEHAFPAVENLQGELSFCYGISNCACYRMNEISRIHIYAPVRIPASSQTFSEMSSSF
jgi:hypothetical protein